MAAETRRVIWQHPRGIYAVIEVSGTGVFGVPYSCTAERRQTGRRPAYRAD